MYAFLLQADNLQRPQQYTIKITDIFVYDEKITGFKNKRYFLYNLFYSKTFILRHYDTTS